MPSHRSWSRYNFVFVTIKVYQELTDYIFLGLYTNPPSPGLQFILHDQSGQFQPLQTIQAQLVFGDGSLSLTPTRPHPLTSFTPPAGLGHRLHD